ncbi:putative sed1-abundant cell surface glyco [Fusarium longipes]|uniref:Putative sed1-abundant cell surface glyco n=1 Tax=Fusarium longipes TaxID=694270 RepID=A0A395RGV2_9HYPO|nr:putative sed1-abundant cell surface glyco [Fusarium longipes]
MAFIKAAAAAAAGLLIGAANASPHYAAYGNGTHYTTEVVTAITTYCPAPTTLTYGDKTYTVTEETTLTITDCPCTISHPLKPTKPIIPVPVPTVVYTTEVVTAITTYCPEPTTLTHGNKTYTVTEPTTFTITDCPCTVTKSQTEHYPQPTPGKPGHPGKPEHPEPGHPTAPAPGKPEHPEAPQTTGPVPVNPTGDYTPPEGTSPAIVTAAAGRIAPAGLLAFIGAIAFF